MKKQFRKRIAAAAMAAAMSAAAVSTLPAIPAYGAYGEILGESTFQYKILPWHLYEQAPAKQDFSIDNGTAHITILKAKGKDDRYSEDLQFRYRKLFLKAGHTYKISFSAKASRNGLKINSRIGDIGEPYNEYFTLKKEGFVQGPHMGDPSGWGEPVELTTEWQTWEGTVECTEDIAYKEWTFCYSAGEKSNTTDGDEIWFDNMSIVDTHGAENWGDSLMTNRHESALVDNFISVNQLGYFKNETKIAVLGDNKSYPVKYMEPYSIELTEDSYPFELVDMKKAKVVYTGTTGKKFYDEDSGETVCKINFSKFTEPGEYFLRIPEKEWRSFPFRIAENPYLDDTHDMLTNALNYFYQNRSGSDINAKYITSGDTKTLAHPGGHKTDCASIQKEWIDTYAETSDATEQYASSEANVSGGWYNSADHSKSMIEGGMALWTLQNLYERAAMTDTGRYVFGDDSGTCVVPEAGNTVPDILDECRYELEFMEKMRVEPDEPAWGELAGLYYHQVQDHTWTGLATRPWDYEEEWETVRILKPPTFAATLNFAACAAQAARLWQNYDAEYAQKLLTEAEDAYQAFRKHYYEADYSQTTHPVYQTGCPREEVNAKSQYAPKYQNTATNCYGDYDVSDDAYWAACELYLTETAMKKSEAANYLKNLSDYQDAFKVRAKITGAENEDGDGSLTLFNWGNTAAAGSLSLALHGDALTADQRDTLYNSILAAADTYLAVQDEQGYGIPYKGREGAKEPSFGPELAPPAGFEYGSNARAVSNMIAMAYAYDLTAESKYRSGVTTGMNYLLGCNPLSFSYVTGYGFYRAMNPQHRFWSYELDDTLPTAPDGVLVAGPTVDLYDFYTRALGFVPYAKDNPSEKCYADSVEAWSVNSVSLSWNASFAWIVSFLRNPQPLPPPPPFTTEPVTTTTGDTTASGTPQALKGDVNCDGGVDVSDVVLILRYAVEDKTAAVTDQGLLNADVDGNGQADSDDGTVILKYIARQIASLEPDAS